MTPDFCLLAREMEKGPEPGTRITFMPDPEIFKDVTFDYDTLEARLCHNERLPTIGLHGEVVMRKASSRARQSLFETDDCTDPRTTLRFFAPAGCMAQGQSCRRNRQHRNNAASERRGGGRPP
jgi:hypothetical protein